MKNLNFDDYLRKTHAKQYLGTDDDMCDDFDMWIVEMSQSDFINHQARFIKKLLKVINN